MIRGNRTRTALLDAGARLVRRERRDLHQLLGSLTITAVAREADLSRNTLRRHFATKRDYLNGLIEHLVVDYLVIDYSIAGISGRDAGDAAVDRLVEDRAPTDVDLGGIIRRFADHELDKWAPSADGRYSHNDAYLLWLHSLIYLDEYPDVAQRACDDYEYGYRSLAENVYGPVLSGLGLRVRAPLEIQDLAEMIGAIFEGYGLWQILDDARVRRELVFDERRWTAPALAAWAIVDRLTEPVPATFGATDAQTP